MISTDYMIQFTFRGIRGSRVEGGSRRARGEGRDASEAVVVTSPFKCLNQGSQRNTGEEEGI